jgi:hypothetical protein
MLALHPFQVFTFERRTTMFKTPLRLHRLKPIEKKNNTIIRADDNTGITCSFFFFLQPFDVTSQSLEITNSDFTARKVAKRKEGEGGRESVT